MKNITLSVPEKDYSFFIKLIKKLDYVEIKDTKKVSTAKQKFLDEFKDAIEEVNQIKAGKKKGRPFQELLDEL
jgi:hypothetical protein